MSELTPRVYYGGYVFMLFFKINFFFKPFKTRLKSLQLNFYFSLSLNVYTIVA